jgi:hypothetical protein
MSDSQYQRTWPQEMSRGPLTRYTLAPVDGAPGVALAIGTPYQGPITGTHIKRQYYLVCLVPIGRSDAPFHLSVCPVRCGVPLSAANE